MVKMVSTSRNEGCAPNATSGSVAARVTSSPATLTTPPPRRSVSRPDSGMVKAAPAPWPISSRPV